MIFQSIRDFKTRYLLTIKHISTSRETLKLLLNIQIILSSIKIQLLQNQQFLNYILHKLIPLTPGSRILFISVNQCLRHNLGYKQKLIQFIRRNQIYFSSSNVSTDTTVIVKDYMLSEKFTFCFKITIKWNLTKSHATRLK